MGCPHQLVKTLENYEKNIDSLRSQGTFITSKSNFENYEQITESYNFDSLNNVSDVSVMDSVGNSSPFVLRVREIDDSAYPDSVVAKVLLYDTTGTAITGMAPPKFIGKGDHLDYWFKLTDSSRCGEIPIKQYKVEEISKLDSEPFSMVFALDHSASMGKGRAELLYKSLKRTLFAVKPGDEVSIVNFTDKPKTKVKLSDDRKNYILRYTFDYEDGGTDTYKAFLHSIDELDSAKAGHKRILVLFSDGDVSLNDEKQKEIRQKALQKGISIYTIVYGFWSNSLKEIAQSTGGRYYPIISSKQFPFVFRDIYLSLNSYYKITYRAPACNDVHKTKVSFRFPELKNSDLTDGGFYDRSIFTEKDTIGAVALINIEFESGSSEIKRESFDEIQNIANSLMKNDDLKLQINGHTDNVGSEEDNMKLSQERADAVKMKLIQMGISSKRLRTKAYGESKPIAPNDTPENKRKNRRTEFVIIEQ